MTKARKEAFYTNVEILASEMLHAYRLEDEEFCLVCDILDAFLESEASIDECIEDLSYYLPERLLAECA